MAKIFSLPNYTSIIVKGPDSEEFLQGQISCDLTKQQENFDGLFCDEKGYIITNSVVIKNDGFVILLREDVAPLLLEELEKFSKFYDCSIKIAPQNIYGKQSNDSFSKHLGKAESNFDEVNWETETMRNFCFDISANYSGKYRLNETGYITEKFVSYEKGCYRGQEIIARLKHLGKTTKKAVIFSGSIKSLSNMDGKDIGKKIFETKHKSDQQTQFFVEKSEYYFNGNKIIPIANQWDLIRD